jgi:ferredoxin
MQVFVNQQRCQGHTQCNMIAGELFHLDDEDGHAFVDRPDVPTHLEDAARAGLADCPERAISLTEQTYDK